MKKELEKENFQFPEKTFQLMNDIVKESGDKRLLDKFKLINTFNDLGKKNRWFGYYQNEGEKLGYWTLNTIVVLVRAEKNKALA